MSKLWKVNSFANNEPDLEVMGSNSDSLIRAFSDPYLSFPKGTSSPQPTGTGRFALEVLLCRVCSRMDDRGAQDSMSRRQKSSGEHVVASDPSGLIPGQVRPCGKRQHAAVALQRQTRSAMVGAYWYLWGCNNPVLMMIRSAVPLQETGRGRHHKRMSRTVCIREFSGRMGLENVSAWEDEKRLMNSSISC